MKTESSVIATAGGFTLTVERHWWAGRGVVPFCWRFTVTAPSDYGPVILASGHYSRGDDTAARGVAIARGRDALAAAVTKFGAVAV